MAVPTQHQVMVFSLSPVGTEEGDTGSHLYLGLNETVWQVSSVEPQSQFVNPIKYYSELTAAYMPLLEGKR